MSENKSLIKKENSNADKIENDSEEIDKDLQQLHSDQATAITLAELIFVYLPLIVLGIVLSLQGKYAIIWSSPEWSFVSAILLGQTMVRIMMWAVKAGYGVIYIERIILLIASIIVFGLVPSLVILTMLLQSPKPSVPLVVCQIIISFLSTIVFFSFNTVADTEIRKYDYIEQTRSKELGLAFAKLIRDILIKDSNSTAKQSENT